MGERRDVFHSINAIQSPFVGVRVQEEKILTIAFVIISPPPPPPSHGYFVGSVLTTL